MRQLLTALVLVAGLIDLLIVGSKLLTPHDPAQMAAAVHGLSIIRAHCTSFFSIAALSMIVGALWKNGDLLLVPTFIFIGAFVERLVNLVVFGFYPQWLLPMALDLVHVALLLAARRALAGEDAEDEPADDTRAGGGVLA